MGSRNDTPEISFDDPGRHGMAQRVTWISVVVNIFLTGAQVVAGIMAHSQGLIADGLHSLSDLVCDFLVLFAAHHSKDPADERHPYGHARIETAASFALGAILAVTGAGIIWGAGVKLQNLDNLPPVQQLALWTAILALVAKEGLFRYMLHVGERLRSPMLIANAWHARSDAASSLVVALGIVGNLIGYNFADSVAAVIVGFMIVRMGVVFAWDAVLELIDTGLSVEEVDSIRQVIIDTPGVRNLHELRTRRMAHRSLVDAHVCVDARISVSEGHRIAEMTRKRILDSHPSVSDVLVHVDVEDDLDHDSQLQSMPDRSELMTELAPLLSDLPEPRRVILHYLNGRIEAELLLPRQSLGDLTAVNKAEREIARQLAEYPLISSLSINYGRQIFPVKGH
ncbi:MAG: cation transporter [Candidatus Accumulibacter sp.]|uniref:Cation transporter n=2 Tax=Candidatus Accumulibacter cognatus TaxID=2954383 RepID=A0A7D5S733_9PROT|nr:cation diffusion facilitator family transporter [Accumulibacter sp.]MCC2866671.1 cation diffusion facilitator family transporter [Candidatus Accumulibacter phosphatis]QLH49256.1 MAG: cation transporter [Candidatus Accumulibacter cognatus]MBL8401003.1 cation transporter [Accumulibacter sp.]MBN8517010.1 cation transporter [Accumulibacter sp.]MBO3709784.1 cation transporter [Accumulibacter sp.]